MKLKEISHKFSVCKLEDSSQVDMRDEYCFFSKTDEEISLVCETSKVPKNSVEREDGWRAFRIEGILDFSLIGILSKISTILAENGIGIFVISTYNTDYIMVKEENFSKTQKVLIDAGYLFQ